MLVFNVSFAAQLDTKLIARTLEVPNYEIFTGYLEEFEVDYEDFTKGGSSIRFLKDIGSVARIAMLIPSGNKTIRFDWKIENALRRDNLQFSYGILRAGVRESVSVRTAVPEEYWCTQTIYLPEGTTSVQWGAFIKNSSVLPRLDNVVILEGERAQSRICKSGNDNDLFEIIPPILNLLLEE